MLDGIYSTPSVSCSTYAQSNGEIRLHLDTGTGGLSSDSSLSISCDDPEPASEEPPPATRSFAQSPTSTLDDDSQRFLIDNAVTSRSKTMALRVADHFLNLFVVTPFIIVYWASSWDIIYVYLFPKDLKISYLITFAFSNIFLFVSYCLQTRLQKFHDSLASRKTYSPGSVQNNHYYDQRFVVRFCYTYMLTWAYVAQWRTYWDLYNTLTSKIEFEYFIGISLVTLLLYRYVLRCSFGSYTQMVPFLLQPDLKFNEYFIQAKVRLVKYKWLENVTSFAYYEFVEMIISVLVWKGVWDLFDVGSDKLFPENKTISILFTLAIGYLLYIILMVIERSLKSVSMFNTTNKKLIRVLTEDVIYLLAYFSMVATWRSFWSGFDQLCLNETPYRVYLISGAHTLTFLLLFVAKLGSSLYGPAGVSNEPTGPDGSFSSFKLFDIRYFSSRSKVR